MSKNSKKVLASKDAKKQKDLAKAKDVAEREIKIKGAKLPNLKTRASGRPPCCTPGCADSSYE